MTESEERKFIIEFIDYYHSLTALWDTNSKDYTNRALKDQQNALLLDKYRERYRGADRKSVAKKINTLRSNYKREVKRLEELRRTGTFSEDALVSPLYYFNAMKFISEIGPPKMSRSTYELFRTPSPNRTTYDDSSSSPEPPPSLKMNSRYDVLSPETSKPKRKTYDSTDTYDVPSPETSKPKRKTYDATNSIETSKPKRKKYDSPSPVDDPLILAVEHMEKPQPDVLENIAKVWGYKLSEMNRTQRILAEKLVNEIMFNGQLGLLHYRTTLSNLISLSRSSTPTSRENSDCDDDSAAVRNECSSLKEKKKFKMIFNPHI